MSNDKKETEEKVMTKYDRKMQRRKEEKAQEAREKRITSVVSVLVLIGFLALALSFPIRSYLQVNGTFVTIGEDKLSRVEFDYNYNVVKNNYINAYGQYLTFFGLDVTQDLASQMYDGDMTWEDYFQEMTVDSLKRNKALKADAAANGYQYDVTGEYADYLENVEKAAKESGMTVKEYVAGQYGKFATLKRIEPFVKESMFVSAYYEKITKDKLPTDEEIMAYYEADKESFDSVDYRMEEVYADLPTEPTDLADPDYVAEEGVPYTPSEAEVAEAMKVAKQEAYEKLKTIATEGTLSEGDRMDEIPDPAKTWLFDSARKAGDKTMLEDEDSNSYVVVSFVKRYRDETPTVDVRAIMTGEDGDAILEEWKNGPATEESFAELAKKYSLDQSTKGGLTEKLTKDTYSDVVNDWLFDSARKPGDTANLKLSDDYCYVAYFVGQNIPQWKVDVQSEMSEQTMTEYVEALTEKMEVKDPSGNLKYIEIRRQQEEAAAEAENEEDGAVDLEGLDIETEDGLEVTDVEVIDEDEEDQE